MERAGTGALDLSYHCYGVSWFGAFAHLRESPLLPTLLAIELVLMGHLDVSSQLPRRRLYRARRFRDGCQHST